MAKYLQIPEWIRNYDKKDWSGDLFAGLTVGVMLIPQGMAYAMLAGMPPIYGLYAATIPIIIYALLGTSRQLSVGPVAMVALLVSSGVGLLAESGTETYIALALFLAFMVGVIQLTMGVFRLGFIVNFLSQPVISGFISAAAIIIFFSQMKNVLGIEIPRGKVHETIYNIIAQFNAFNIPTILVGVVSMSILVFIKKMKNRIPGPVVIVLLGIIITYLFRLNQYGVKIIRDVPSGLPSFGIPDMEWNTMLMLLPTALTISFISFMQSFAVAKAIQKKHKYYELDNNRELIALGLSNIGGSFFQAFPVSGGFSRTAVNDQSGARSGLASIISASLIIMTLLFFTKYFYFLPKAVLSSIIMVAVVGLIEFKEARHLFKTDRKDFTLFMITALGTLALGIEEGVLLGALISLAMVIYQAAYPHIAILARVKNSPVYKNINRFDDLLPIKDTFIFRFDARLYFANCNYFRDFLIENTNGNKALKNIILDATAINGLDSTAVHMLCELLDDLGKRKIRFIWVGVKGPVRDVMQKNGMFEKIGKEHFFNSIEEAVDFVESGKENKHTKDYTLQSFK